jgi:23S rRNA (cytosine1962-C5)-methyltransferase
VIGLPDDPADATRGGASPTDAPPLDEAPASPRGSRGPPHRAALAHARSGSTGPTSRSIWPAILRPSFDPARILFEDPFVIGVDKPEGVPSQAADPAHPDDVVHRLGHFLAERDGVRAPAYLGVHQRLDQDTSGVLLYAKRKEANARIAQQLEGRSAEKRYVAVVEGWRGGDRRLEHALARGADGRTHVAPRDRRAKRAVSHVHVLSRHGARALLELRIETGRTHQIRAQLAAEGAPVSGDRLYGGAPADRLMLHAASISLAHPVTGAPLRVEAPLPACFEEALAGAGDAAALHPGSAPRNGRTGNGARESAPSTAPAGRSPPSPPFEGVDGAERGARGHTAPSSSRPRDEPGGRAVRDSLRGALARAAERRWGLAHRANEAEPTTAYRLIHEGGDGLAGLAVDVYDGWLVAHVYDDTIEAQLDRVLDALEALGARGIYVKRRPKQANVIVDGRAEAFAPSLPVRGEAAPEPLVIFENGLPFRVRLGEGLSTGVFLDQRANRARVRELAKGARVLNLFAYTCAFTVAAAAGGARESLSVDASSRVLAWGRENLAGAGLASSAHRFEPGDVFDVLARLAREKARFDLVCVDPPTYSTTRASRWTSGGDWRELGARVLRVLAPRGKVLACSNDRRLSQQKFRRYLHDAARDASVSLAQLKDLPCPADFPPPFGADPHLKSVLATRAS